MNVLAGITNLCISFVKDFVILYYYKFVFAAGRIVGEVNLLN
jgi:hypothetical protein